MPPETETPRRVTVSQLALQLASRQPSNPTSSVKLTRNASGNVQIDVDVTDRDPDVAAEKARELFDRLVEVYPRVNGNGDGK